MAQQAWAATGGNMTQHPKNSTKVEWVVGNVDSMACWRAPPWTAYL